MKPPRIFKSFANINIQIIGIDNDDTDVQVARILVAGGIASGEDEFMRTFSRFASTYDVYQEPAWNCGIRLHLDDNLALQLVSLGGSLFMNYWLETIEPHIDTVLGTIYFLDAERPRWCYKEALSRIHTLEDYHGWQGVPYMFACTGLDKPVALSPDEIRFALNIPPEIPVVPCVATDPESVKSVLLALLYHVRDMPEKETDESDV